MRRRSGKHRVFASLAVALIWGATATITSAASLKDIYAMPNLFSWTGFYVGGQTGAQWSQHDFADPVYQISGNSSSSGFIGGGHVGFNWQYGRIVTGLEADFEWTDASGSGLAYWAGRGAALGEYGTFDTKWQASLRARLGVVTNSTLFYVTGGAAWSRNEFTYFGNTDNITRTVPGWTIGGGIEHMLAYNWIAKFEYRYSDFEQTRGSIINCCAGPPNFQVHSLETHAIRSGFSYKF